MTEQELIDDLIANDYHIWDLQARADFYAQMILKRKEEAYNQRRMEHEAAVEPEPEPEPEPESEPEDETPPKTKLRSRVNND